MTRKALGLMFGVVLAFALVVVPNTRANDIDQATQLTFSRPVQLPGNVVLPEGTYWFVVPSNDTKAVQVFDGDRIQVIATVATTDVIRGNMTDETQLTFADVGSQPLALVSWFYPDRLTGHKFVYSDGMARKLSESNEFTVTGDRIPRTPGG